MMFANPVIPVDLPALIAQGESETVATCAAWASTSGRCRRWL